MVNFLSNFLPFDDIPIFIIQGNILHACDVVVVVVSIATASAVGLVWVMGTYVVVDVVAVVDEASIICTTIVVVVDVATVVDEARIILN